MYDILVGNMLHRLVKFFEKIENVYEHQYDFQKGNQINRIYRI